MDDKIKAALLGDAKPILFNGEMVYAILEGIKTETRRVVKPQPCCSYPRDCGCTLWDHGRVDAACPEYCVDMHDAPFAVGDILYVRETWAKMQCFDCVNGDTYSEAECYIDRGGLTIPCDDGIYIYKATDCLPKGYKWRPSIHMPKEAARIFLRVTGVQAERLQDIAGEGCQNEGIAHVRTRRIDASTLRTYGADRFAAIWDSTIKRADLPRYGWEANPWVWVIEFKRIEVDNDDR